MSTKLTEERYKELVEYLRSVKRGAEVCYPEGLTRNQKRGLRQQADCFQEKDGALFHFSADQAKLLRVVVSQDEKERIMKACHSGVDGGHFGRDKTISKLSASYWWKGIQNDVADYCKRCDTCQRVNNRFGKVKAELHPIPVTAVWDQIGVDLIGPLPETSRGNKYLITVTDYFSKWPEAGALKDKTAIGVANFLFSLFCRYGWPMRIVSDQGREFVNAVSRCLYDLTNVEHRISSAYHPQTNGLDERMNQTLMRTLKKVVDQDHNWDEHIDSALYAYRISTQSSSKFSPFFLMFTRHPRKAIDFELSRNDPNTQMYNDDSIEKNLEKVLYVRQKYHEKAHQNIQEAQERQKYYFDLKHDTHHHFEIGSQVLLKNMKNSHRMGGKMDPKWLGPYTVNEKVSKGRYKLCSKSGATMKKLYSSCLLKEYFEPGGGKADRSCVMNSDVENEDCDSDVDYYKAIVAFFQKISPEDLVTEYSAILSADEISEETIKSKFLKSSCKRRNQLKAAGNAIQCMTKLQYEAVGDFLIAKYCTGRSMKLFSYALDVILPQILCHVLMKKYNLDCEKAESVMYTSIIEVTTDRKPEEDSKEDRPKCCKRKLEEGEDDKRKTGRKHLKLSSHAKGEDVSRSETGVMAKPRVNKLAQNFISKCKNHGQEKIQWIEPIIDVNNIYEPTHARQQKLPKKWIAELGLFESDKSILLSPVGWTTDAIVNASQKLLKSQFPSLNGLQDTALGYVMSFEIQQAEFLQILHSSGNHWLLVSSIGLEYPNVNVFDSLYDVVSTSVKSQIASLLCTQQKSIKVKIMDVQRQVAIIAIAFKKEGSYDCGLFAIAFATALAYNINPTKCFFDQSKMRKHLFSCLSTHKMSPFPERKGTLAKSRSVVEDDIYVHCICRMLELKNVAMIECSQCAMWYHAVCLDVHPKYLDSSDDTDWFCPLCK